MAHPKLDLSGKTAVVIGGTSGIGLALNKGLALAGANVVATGRRAELVRKAAEDVKALGRRSLAQTCDVTDEASIEKLLAAVLAEFGSVEILVNCAGADEAHTHAAGSRRRVERHFGYEPERNVASLPGLWAAHDRAEVRAHH